MTKKNSYNKVARVVTKPSKSANARKKSKANKTTKITKSPLPSNNNKEEVVEEKKEEAPRKKRQAFYDCCLCSKTKIEGYGNNPEPLGSHTENCCDDCNAKVIEARKKSWVEPNDEVTVVFGADVDDDL